MGCGASATTLLADLFLGIKALTTGSSIDDIADGKFWRALRLLKHFKCTIIEEKRKDPGKRNLIDCVPQVMGEALALYVACYFFQQSRSNLDF